MAVKNNCLAQAPAKVTDPRNMLLAGVPPKDLIEDVAQALIAAGYDPDECFPRSCDVTQEQREKKQTRPGENIVYVYCLFTLPFF